MREKKPGKVIGVGLATMDQLLLWRDTSAPVAGNRVIEYDVQGGGMVGTALVAVARLGGPAEFWGAVGTDWMADWVLDGLRREGVDVGQVRRVEAGRGPMVVVCVDQPTGQRHFLHFVGIGSVDLPLGDGQRLDGAGCLLVDHTRRQAELAAAAEARRLGIPVVADLSRVEPSMHELLHQVDYAICSELCQRDLPMPAGSLEACRHIQALGPRCVVVTMGDRGLVWLDGDCFGRMEAFAVDVVDTTGAGDTFHGAFCYGLTRGLPVETNLRLASAVAAMKCRRLGGRAGLPSLPEALAFLAERGFGLRAELAP